MAEHRDKLVSNCYNKFQNFFITNYINCTVSLLIMQADSTGEQPPFMDVYMKTHLHAEAKKRYFEGDRELRSADFICGTAEDAAVSYIQDLYMNIIEFVVQ